MSDTVYQDPRDWAWDSPEVTNHLASVGLQQPRETSAAPFARAGYRWYSMPLDTLEQSIGAVGFYFSTTWDTRTVQVVLDCTTYIRSELCALGAHKGMVTFLWWRTVPTGYAKGEFVDLVGDTWLIEESVTVQSQMDTEIGQQPINQYAAYLSSPEWLRTRELALEYYGSKCCLCNRTDNLNVHHRTYERKGNERLSDLIVLCRDCHAKFHGKPA